MGGRSSPPKRGGWEAKPPSLGHFCAYLAPLSEAGKSELDELRKNLRGLN